MEQENKFCWRTSSVGEQVLLENKFCWRTSSIWGTGSVSEVVLKERTCSENPDKRVSKIRQKTEGTGMHREITLLEQGVGLPTSIQSAWRSHGNGLYGITDSIMVQLGMTDYAASVNAADIFATQLTGTFATLFGWIAGTGATITIAQAINKLDERIKPYVDNIKDNLQQGQEASVIPFIPNDMRSHMYFINSGNVGIGYSRNTQLSAKLHINGNLKCDDIIADQIGLGTSTNHTNTLLDVRGNCSFGDSLTLVQAIALKSQSGVWHITSDNGGNGGNNQFVISSLRTINGVPNVETKYLLIENGNGNIGVGKTPLYKLDVDGDVNCTGNFRVNGTLLNTSSSQWTTTGNDIYYNTGSVGINNSSPSSSYKLDVVGDVNITGNYKVNGTDLKQITNIGNGLSLNTGSLTATINYVDLEVDDVSRTISSTTTGNIQEPTYTTSSYVSKVTLSSEYKYIMFDYFANTFDFREDESPYSWQEAYDEAIANGKRMATKTEFRNYLSGLGYTLQTGDPKPPLYSGDTWCFCTGDDGISYDAIQIGEHGSQYVGSSLADILSQTDAFWTGTYTDSFPKIYLEVSCKYYINFPQNTTCDILVIGGGGGGGYDRAGGAGAGACIVYKGYIMNGTYDIKTGNGGGGQSSTTQIDGYHAGKNGFDSEITSGTTTLFRAKGGGGGAQHINSGRNGGCGGGAGSQSSTHIGGVATANIILGNNVSGAPSGNSGTNYVAYGSSGGSTFVNYTGSFDNLDGSGGGGIGENGQDKTSALGNNGGKGGDGRYNFTVNAISNTFNQHFGITGHLVNGNHYIGGGGGGGDMRGGVAGIGGGGGGGTGGESNSVGNNASAYGAGGGGGGGDARAGGNGYDGVVVIRYKYATISTTTTTETYTPTGNLIYCRTSTNDYEWKFSSDAIFNELSYQYKLYDMMYDLNKIFVNYEYSVNNTNYYPMFAYDVINENDNIYKINVGNSTAKIRIGKTSLHYIEKMRPLVGVSYNGVKIQLNYFNSGGTYLSQSEVNYTGSILDTIDIDSSIISTNMGQYGTINDVIIIELKLLNTTNSLIEYDSQFFLLTNAGTIA